MTCFLLLLVLVLGSWTQDVYASLSNKSPYYDGSSFDVKPAVSANPSDPFLTRRASQFTYGKEAVADWGQLPFSSTIAQVVLAPALFKTPGARSAALLLTSEGQLFAATASARAGAAAAAAATRRVVAAGKSFGEPQELGASAVVFTAVTVTGAGAVQALKQNGTRLRRPSSGFMTPSNGNADLPSLSFVNGQGVFRCNVSGYLPTSPAVSCAIAAPAVWSTEVQVNDVVQTMIGDIWIAADDGLYYLPAGSSAVQKIQEVTTRCAAVAFDDASNSIAAGFNWLWRRVPSDVGTTWHYFLTPGIIDDNITALEFDADSVLWVANAICVNKQHLDLAFERVGGLAGLVVANLTSLSLSTSGAMWLGSKLGVVRYLPIHRHDARDFQDAEWQYFHGPRWIPSASFEDDNQAVVPLGMASFLEPETPLDATIVITTNGVSVLEYFFTTLAEKAEHFQYIAQSRHDRPPGLSADVGLRKFGNVSSFVYESNDNDGLWTSVYTASQAFRYAVTKDPAAKKEAWHRFEALEFLNSVTGIKGLMARSVLHMANPPPHEGGVWHNSTVHPGWIWKGDTSSDEVAGHLFVYPLIHDLVAETPEEKARARSLIYDITHYIQSNGWYLIDVTGKPTTWGRWAPKELNHDQLWYDERGPNSLQILSYLLSAFRITGDQYFMVGFNDLVNNHGYGINIINQKITEPDDDNYSDDELAYLPYYTWIHANVPVLKAHFATSIRRAHRINLSERSDLWDSIYGAFAQSVSETERLDITWTLRDWAWSCVDWPTQNSDRIDIRFNPNEDRFNRMRTQSERVLPYMERTMLRWNANPFELDGGSGFTESDPGAWLLPYWMARYHKFL